MLLSGPGAFSPRAGALQVPGESVYGEKRISVEESEGVKTEYRVWNPFRSKLAASVLAGVDNLHVKPGCKVSPQRPPPLPPPPPSLARPCL